MPNNPFFNAHHSPSGPLPASPWAFPLKGGGLDMEMGRPPGENVFIGLESREPGHRRAGVSTHCREALDSAPVICATGEGGLSLRRRGMEEILHRNNSWLSNYLCQYIARHILGVKGEEGSGSGPSPCRPDDPPDPVVLELERSDRCRRIKGSKYCPGRHRHSLAGRGGV